MASEETTDEDGFLEFRAVIHFLVLRNEPTTRIVSMIAETYGDSAPSQRFVYKWARRFRDGRESLRDDPRSGRPKTTTSLAESISDVLEERPFESVRTLSDALGFSRETIRITLHELGLRKFSLRFVPHTLSPSQKQKRVEVSRGILEHLESPGGLNNVITGDETWIFHENPHDKRWAASSSEAGTRVTRTIGAKKSMVSVFWTIKGFLVVEALPEGMTFDSAYASSLLHKLDQVVGESRPKRRLRGMFLHWDNARPHKSAFTTEAADRLKTDSTPAILARHCPERFFPFWNAETSFKGTDVRNRA